MNQVTRKGAEAYELFSGDQITVGVTHQIEVGRDKSWVKYEAVTRLRPGEAAADARTRAVGHVNESIGIAVHQTVESVRSQYA
jgi:hypothetical protein